MRIDRMHIDRFGIIADQSVPVLSPGLTVFLGRNEAGKSTCLRFFRSMLFGYKRGKSSLDPMTVRPGKSLAGGSLFLHSETGGDLILSRRPGAHGGVLSLADASGSPLHGSGDNGEALLSRLLGGMSMDVFDAIFAFSLKELMEFSSLSGPSIRHALHGAAFGQGLRSPAQVLKRLNDKMALLLKADRGSAAINNTWRELKEVQEALLARESEVARYAALNAELAALDGELVLLRGERDGQQALLRRSRRRRDLWQQWEALGRVRAELAELRPENPENSPEAERPPVFAPDAVQRLDALLAQGEERLLAVKGQERTLARLSEELARLNSEAPTDADQALLARVQSLREQKERRRAEAESLPGLAAECARLETAQEESLATLGPGWDAGRVASLDLSLPAGQALLDKGNQVRQLTDRLERMNDECRRLGDERDEAARQEEEAARRTPPDLALETDLPDRAQAARLAGAMAEAASRLAELPVLLERRGRAEAEARLALADIDPTLSADALRAVDPSPASRQRLLAAASECLAAARQRDEAAQRAKAANEGLESALAKAARLRERAEEHAALPDGQSLAARQHLLRRLRDILADLVRARHAAKEARQTAEAGESPALPLARNPLFLAGIQLVLAGLALAAGGLAASFPALLYSGAAMVLLGLPPCLLHKLAGGRAGAEAGPEHSAPSPLLAAAERAEAQLAALAEEKEKLRAEAAPWLSEILPSPNELAGEPEEEAGDGPDGESGGVPGGEPSREPDGKPGEAADEKAGEELDATALDRALLILETQVRSAILAERDRADLAEAESALDAARLEAEKADAQRGRATLAFERAAAAHAEGIAGLGLARAVPPEETRALFEAVSAALLRDLAAQEAAGRVREAAATVRACFTAAGSQPFFATALEQSDAGRPGGSAPDLTGVTGPDSTGVTGPDSTGVTALEQPGGRAGAEAGLEALGRAMTALEALREQEQERRQAASILRERQEARERLEQRLTRAQSARAEAEQALAEAERARRGALASFGLPEGVSPESAAEALALMRAVTARDKEIRANAERAAALEKGLAAFTDEVTGLARALGVAVPAAFSPSSTDGSPASRRIPTVLALLDSLTARAEEAGRAASARAARQEQHDLCARELESAREALALTEKAVSGLLSASGAADPESFRAAFARYSRIEVLRREERGLLEALRNLAAEEEVALETLFASFAESDPEALIKGENELAETLAGLEAGVAERSQRRGALLERRAALVRDSGAGSDFGSGDEESGDGESGDGSGADLRAREAGLREELRRLSRQWAVPALARELLLAAKERFEREGRQGVLRHAGDMFQAVTGGEYSGISLGFDGESFLALHHSGDLRDPEKQLSQGTREQLYLALRLAFIRNHAEKAEPLPVFMDDILVNFDPERAAATAAVLSGFAATNQLLFFTCHPATAEALTLAARDGEVPPRLYHIERGSISEA